MIMQYLTENPDMLHNRVSDNTHRHSQQFFFRVHLEPQLL